MKCYQIRKTKRTLTEREREGEGTKRIIERECVCVRERVEGKVKNKRGYAGSKTDTEREMEKELYMETIEKRREDRLNID